MTLISSQSVLGWILCLMLQVFNIDDLHDGTEWVLLMPMESSWQTGGVGWQKPHEVYKKCRVLYLGWASSMGWISKITASKCRNGIIPLGTHKAISEIKVLWFWAPSTQRKINKLLFKLYTYSIVSLNLQEQYIFYIQKKAFLSYNNSHLPKVNI